MRPATITRVNSHNRLFTPNLTKLTILFLAIWAWFYTGAIDQTDWWLENILVIMFLPLLWLRRRKFLFSPASLCCIFLFLTLHIYGARTAYTQNELGELLQETWVLPRNPYDRIVHFSFGFLLVYPFIELVYSKLKINMPAIILIANMAILCLASIFELLEWAVAASTNSVTSETYVATQGDLWDAQKDIILAVAGAAISSIIILLRKNRRQDYNFQRVK